MDACCNSGERRGSFEMVMKPYPIPVTKTTYVQFAFNIPDDAPDLFHVVRGEVVNSQPEHLHHFVFNGCPTRIDPSDEGLPRLDWNSGLMCHVPLGGWTLGDSSAWGSSDLDMARLLGRGMGVEAVLLDVHCNDGAYADAATRKFKMAADGIRVH